MKVHSFGASDADSTPTAAPIQGVVKCSRCGNNAAQQTRSRSVEEGVLAELHKTSQHRRIIRQSTVDASMINALKSMDVTASVHKVQLQRCDPVDVTDETLLSQGDDPIMKANTPSDDVNEDHPSLTKQPSFVTRQHMRFAAMVQRPRWSSQASMLPKYRFGSFLRGRSPQPQPQN